MGYIPTTCRGTLSLDAARRLAELAKKDITPAGECSDYEFAIWMLMRELVEYGEDKKNFYTKIPKRTSQHLQRL